jgi:hypothetical protein
LMRTYCSDETYSNSACTTKEWVHSIKSYS